MKRIIALMTVIAFVSAIARSDEPADVVRAEAADSISVTMLDEFVVEGKSALVGKEGILFRPSKEEVKHSANAYSLIQNMSIPFLKSTGYSINSEISSQPEYFIDYHRATDADMYSLQPKDVLKVEFLLFPEDVRFQGAKVVLHFVMKPRDSGGYVKGNFTQNFIRDNGNYSLYGKYVTGKWAFDLSSLFGYYNSDSRTITETNYSGFDKLSETYYPEITRYSDSKGKLKNYMSSTDFRFKYSGNGFRVSNSFGFLYDKKPRDEAFGSISYSHDVYAKTTSTTRTSGESVQPYWKTSMYLKANGKLSFSLNGEITYSHILKNKLLETDEFSPVSNDSKEDNMWEHVSLYANYRSNSCNSFNLSASGSWSQYDNHYYGSVYGNPQQEVRYWGGRYGLGWTHERNNGIRLSLSGYASYSNTSINGDGYAHWSPSLFVNFYYPISNGQFLSAQGSYRTVSPSVRNQQNVEMQLNEIEWFAGSRSRDYGSNYELNLNYMNALSESFSLSSYLLYNQYSSIDALTFTPVDAYKIVRSSDCNGKFRLAILGISATAKLFDNSLHLTSGLSYRYNKGFGGLDWVNRRVVWNVDAKYYLGDFAFSAYYTTPDMSTNLINTYYRDDMYGVGISYSRNDLYLYLTIDDFLKKESFTTTEYCTDNYRNVVKSSAGGIFQANSRCVTVGLVYTVDFGKKVSKWDVVKASESVKSTGL